MNRSSTLSIIRVAMLGGVVVFGAVALYVARQGTVGPLGTDALSTLRTVFVVFLGATAVAMFYFRTKRVALRAEDDPTALNIVGWALGEATALFGAVILFLSGDLTYFLVGVMMMLVAFVFFPIPHE